MATAQKRTAAKKTQKTLVPDFQRDVQEWYIHETMPDVLDTLLLDCTLTKRNRRKTNIMWGTDDYIAEYGEAFAAKQQMLAEQIAVEGKRIICPRVDKRADEQRKRSVEKAEVFTPSWVCNRQNNLVDEAWFGRATRLFNVDKPNAKTKLPWTSTTKPIPFFKTHGKTWQEYVLARRIEVSCGEAPYLTSRYDTTSGAFIPVGERIGLLDRKLRIVTEHCGDDKAAWRTWAEHALQNTYGFEWQGDNVFIARENLLYAVLEAYSTAFDGATLDADTVRRYAEIISWNVWQMDGIKFVIPDTCHDEDMPKDKAQYDCPDWFSDTIPSATPAPELPLKIQCRGCKSGNVAEHNGVRCIVRDWKEDKLFEFKPPFSHLEEYREGS